MTYNLCQQGLEGGVPNLPSCSCFRRILHPTVFSLSLSWIPFFFLSKEKTILTIWRGHAKTECVFTFILGILLIIMNRYCIMLAWLIHFCRLDISKQTGKKSCFPCPNFGRSCFLESSKILNLIKIFCIFPHPGHGPHLGQILGPEKYPSRPCAKSETVTNNSILS